MNVDLAKNPKQEEFFNKCIEAAHGLNEYRNLSYGGAIRGGKTFVCLTTLVTLAKTFKGFRSHVIRSDFPALKATAIPSTEKILYGTFNWKWNRDKSDYFAYHQKSDSKIFFRGENIDRDPELLNFLGLETNAILYEQIEEISEKTYEIGQSRNGSWYIDPMPKPLTLATFNPTQTWIKKKVYEPWVKGELLPPHYFQHALPNDNAFVTQEQWNAWGNLADRYQDQFIKGDWTNFGDKQDQWAWAFDRNKHISKDLENKVWKGSKDNYMYLSFDFNRNPITCSVIQHINGCIYVLKQYKLSNSDIYQICERIKIEFSGFTFIVTGDASGQNGSAMVKDNLNYYKIIKKQLGLGEQQFKLPRVNPRLEENQVLVNSLLSKYNIQIHPENAKALVYDLENVRMHADGTIVKENRDDPTQQADSIDCFRYYCNQFHRNFVKV